MHCHLAAEVSGLSLLTVRSAAQVRSWLIGRFRSGRFNISSSTDTLVDGGWIYLIAGTERCGAYPHSANIRLIKDFPFDLASVLLARFPRDMPPGPALLVS